jgi:hypothetical protein
MGGEVRIVHGILQSLQQGQHMLLDRWHGTLLIGGQRAARHAGRLIGGMLLLLAMRTSWVCDGWRVGCVGGGRFGLAFIGVPRHLVVTQIRPCLLWRAPEGTQVAGSGVSLDFPWLGQQADRKHRKRFTKGREDDADFPPVVSKYFPKTQNTCTETFAQRPCFRRFPIQTELFASRGKIFQLMGERRGNKHTEAWMSLGNSASHGVCDYLYINMKSEYGQTRYRIQIQATLFGILDHASCRYLRYCIYHHKLAVR